MHQEDDNIVCTMEDLIFIKPGNKVKLEYRKNKYPLEVYVLYIGGELLRKLSDEETRLDEAFDFVPYQVKIVHSESESAMLIKNISKKLYSMNNEPPKFCPLIIREKPINYDSCTCTSLICSGGCTD